MRFFTIIIVAVMCAFMLGYYFGARPRTCAYVQVSEGSGIVCSNDLSGWVRS